MDVRVLIERLATFPRVVILGPPESGKSYLLRSLQRTALIEKNYFVLTSDINQVPFRVIGSRKAPILLLDNISVERGKDLRPFAEFKSNPNLRFVVAGRCPVPPFDEPWSFLYIPPLTLEEARVLLREMPGDIQEEVFGLTGGHPGALRVARKIYHRSRGDDRFRAGLLRGLRKYVRRIFLLEDEDRRPLANILQGRVTTEDEIRLAAHLRRLGIIHSNPQNIQEWAIHPAAKSLLDVFMSESYL